jgi:hypothetical protein
MIAMARSTELDVGRLTAPVTQINLPQGRIYLHVRQLDDTHTFEIAIPRGGVLLLRPGYYGPNQPRAVRHRRSLAGRAGRGRELKRTTVPPTINCVPDRRSLYLQRINSEISRKD